MDDFVLLPSGVLNIHRDFEDTSALVKNRVDLIQFAAGPLSSTTLARIDAEVLRAHPDATLRVVLNGAGAFDDLSFIQHLPHLRAIRVEALHEVDLSPLRPLELRTFGISSHAVSLKPLAGKPIEILWCGSKVKDFATISTWGALREITFRQQSLRNLAFLHPLAKLTRLSFMLGGTRNFVDMPPGIDSLSIQRTRMLESTHLASLNHLPELHHLRLAELPRITSLAWLTNPHVTHLELHQMAGLSSYSANLPNLERLTIEDNIDAALVRGLTFPRLKRLEIFKSQMPHVLGLETPFDIVAI